MEKIQFILDYFFEPSNGGWYHFILLIILVGLLRGSNRFQVLDSTQEDQKE